MRDMPPCLASRTEHSDGSGYTEIREECECGAILISTGSTAQVAERHARDLRAPHTQHRHTVQT
jgi:hypothetical protein